jgi:DNA repair ATPase RecN
MGWGEVIVAMITAIAAAVGLDRLIIYLMERKERKRLAEATAAKAEAEAEKTEAETAVIRAEAEQACAKAESQTLENAFRLIRALSQQLQYQEERANRLERRVTRVESTLRKYAARIEYLMEGIKILLGQLEKACIEPEWKPSEWEYEPEDET